MTWFHETLHGAAQQSLEVSSLIFRGKTSYQSIEIFENSVLGRVLVLDGIVQTTERDEYIYHEMLTHPAIIAHGEATEILIIGGGDGGALEEVLKHPIESVTMVEIDTEVVALCRKHMPMISDAAFDDSRTRLIIGDGTSFVAETQDRFDIIVVDSTDPVGPGTALFEQSFYKNCMQCLKPRGYLVVQNGVPFLQADELIHSDRNFAEIFGFHGFYFASIPTYYGGLMAFGWASLTCDFSSVELEKLRCRYTDKIFKTRYYNPEIHCASLAVPNDIRALLA